MSGIFVILAYFVLAVVIMAGFLVYPYYSKKLKIMFDPDQIKWPDKKDKQ